MITLYLRFPNMAMALAAFAIVTGQDAETVSDVPSKVVVNGVLCDVDPIGPITRETGALDVDGLPVAEIVPGWHVNIWLPDTAIVPPELEPFRVYPVTPSRGFGS